MFELDPEKVKNFFLYVFPILITAITIHELAHCWTTDRLGDDTPRRAGRITLNPLAHLDPYGTIFMVISGLTGFGIGWGKAAIFNPANFRNPARDRMLSAVAGPFSNILQFLAWGSLGLLFSSLYPNEYTLYLCYYGVIINAALALFNLLPVYPLDGHHILSYLAPPSWRPIIDNPLWGLAFLFLVFSGKTDMIIGPLIEGALQVTQLLVGWPS